MDVMAVFRQVGAADFSTIFSDHPYIFALALLDVQHLKNSTNPSGLCGIATAPLSTFSQRSFFSRNSDFGFS